MPLVFPLHSCYCTVTCTSDAALFTSFCHLQFDEAHPLCHSCRTGELENFLNSSLLILLHSHLPHVYSPCFPFSKLCSPFIFPINGCSFTLPHSFQPLAPSGCPCPSQDSRISAGVLINHNPAASHTNLSLLIHTLSPFKHLRKESSSSSSMTV